MLDNCFRFAPRDSIPGLIAKICKYLKDHPGWSEKELEEQIKKFISATGVESFNGRTGIVTLDKNDVNNLKIAPSYFAEGAESIDSLDLVSLYNQGVRFVFTDFNSVTSGYNLAFVLEYLSGSGNVVYYQMPTGSGGGGNIVSVNGKTGVVELSLADIVGSSGIQVKLCKEEEFTSTTTETWNEYYGEGYRIVCVVNSSVTSIDHIYVLKQDENNHIPIGLSTGASNAYTPTNPPPYPVTNVNTKTGSVNLKVVDVSNGNSLDENAYIFIDEGEDYGDVIADNSRKLDGKLPSYYATKDALDTLDNSVSPMINKTGTPYAAGKVWTSLASGAGWADPAGGTQIDLLWQNARPTSDFDGQSVSLDLSNYDMVMVEARYTTGMANGAMFICPVGKNGMIFFGNTVNLFRMYSVSVSGVIFETGKKLKTYNGSTEDLGRFCVPTAIYGIKGVSA